MATGSCLCGRVAFEIDAAGVEGVVGCYCVNCRKVSGAQAGVYLQVRAADFRWVAGEDAVVAFESSPGNLRGHCGVCGCVAPIATSYSAVRVPGGALDEDPGLVPDVVLFQTRKAPWCDLASAKLRFDDAGPADFWRALIVRLLTAR
jgi:hypothetical protein